jgi:hypothetical protein
MEAIISDLGVHVVDGSDGPKQRMFDVCFSPQQRTFAVATFTSALGEQLCFGGFGSSRSH